MREVYCVGYTPRVWDPRSLQSILDVSLYFSDALLWIHRAPVLLLLDNVAPTRRRKYLLPPDPNKLKLDSSLKYTVCHFSSDHVKRRVAKSRRFFLFLELIYDLTAGVLACKSCSANRQDTVCRDKFPLHYSIEFTRNCSSGLEYVGFHYFRNGIIISFSRFSASSRVVTLR